MGRRRFCGDPRIRTTFAFPKQDITILHSFLKTVYEGDDHAPSVIVMPSKLPVLHFECRFLYQRSFFIKATRYRQSRYARELHP